MHFNPLWLLPAIPAAGAVILGSAAFGTLAHHLGEIGLARVIFRAATGNYLDGNHSEYRTNRTWLHWGDRPWHPHHQGHMAHMTKWARMPRLYRAAFFWVPLLGPPLFGDGLLIAPSVTLASGAAVTWATLLWAGRCVWRKASLRGHRRTVEHPLAVALSHRLQIGPRVLAERLSVTPRCTAPVPGQVLARIRHLPDTWGGTDSERDYVEDVFRGRLPGDLGFDWDQMSWPRRLTVYCASAPPAEVLAATWAEFMAGLGHRQYFIGCTDSERPVIWDANFEDPMLAIGGRTRDGKTNAKLAIAAQALRRGVHVTVIDPKRVSFRCLQGVPGLTLANNPGNVRAMWDAVHAVRVRMDDAIRRGQEAPGELLIIEEANVFRGLSRAAWETENKSSRFRVTDVPAWLDIQAILAQGAQFSYQVIVSGQDLKDDVLYGTRSQFGTVMLNGFNAAQWHAVTTITPVPPSPGKRGRFAYIQGSAYRWVQVVIAHPAGGAANEQAWRTYALNGRTTTRARQDMPWTLRVLGWRKPSPAIRGLIIGNQAAADHLHMTSPAFQRAKGRRPIPGEDTIRRNGRKYPCWTADQLNNWAATLPMGIRRQKEPAQ